MPGKQISDVCGGNLKKVEVRLTKDKEGKFRRGKGKALKHFETL